MESLTTFTFESAKILSTTLLSRDLASVKYTTSTVRKGSSRQSTSLVGAPGSPDTEIDWKRNTFTISGETRHVGELRKKRATFSSSRYWSWFDCEEYRVKYDSELENTWTVSSYSGTVLATFSSNIHRVFHGNSLPALNLSSSIHDEDERRFIILVLLYSEIKRLESLRAVAIDFIGRRNVGL
ncbi:hypothetical protein B0H15DRAFT_796467 [Mycena belliarum]|uniref:Uncharacterized protein n=1 Tax=Mycena belliarum TaxID=1033014 RepID=A0AAD6UHM8_9AGAR|nr:hypothetical protein B0H15DRAFT_796467 [Mycena belliae]